MKSLVAFGSLALILGWLTFAPAEEPTAPLPLPAISVPAAPPLTAAPLPGWIGGNAGKGDPSYHFTADVGLGVYSVHGGGLNAGPLLGTNGSVEARGERAGIGVGWSQFSNSVGTWSRSHR